MRRRQVASLIGWLVPAGLLLSAPYLLATRPLRSTLESLLSRHFRIPVRLRDADLGWNRATVFRGLSSAVDDRPDEPWLRVERVELGASLPALLLGESPFALTCDQAVLQLESRPAGDTLLSDCLDRAGRDRLQQNARRWSSIALRNSRLTLDNRKVELAARIERDARGLSELVLEVGLQGSRGKGALALNWRRSESQGDPHRLSLAASRLALSDFQPLWRSLFPAGSLTGRTDLVLDASAGSGLFDLTVEGELSGLEISFGTAWPAGGLRDPQVLIAGSCSVDLRDRRCSFHGFALQSSILFVEAEGAAFVDQGPLDGDLRLRAGADLGRAAARAAPLVRHTLPALTLGGNLDLQLEPAEEGGFHLVANGEQLESQVDATRLLALDQAHFETDLQFDPSDRSLRLEHSSLSFPYADLTGRCRIALEPEFARTFELAARLRADGGPANLVLFQALGRAPFAQVAGEVEAQLELARTQERQTGNLRVESDDFDLRVEPRPGRPDDTYFFRAQPFRLAFDGSFPGPAPWTALEGAFSLRAGVCTIVRDVFLDLELAGSLRDRTIDLNSGTAATREGGRVTTTGSLQWPEDQPATLRLDLQGRDLELQPITTRLAALCSPAFAHNTYPWNLEGSVRLGGRGA